MPLCNDVDIVNCLCALCEKTVKQGPLLWEPYSRLFVSWATWMVEGYDTKASGAALPKFEQFGKSNVTAEQAREYAAARSAASAHNVLERWWLGQRWLGQRRRRSWSARRRRKVVQAHRYVHNSLHKAFIVSRRAVVDLVATSDKEVVMVD